MILDSVTIKFMNGDLLVIEYDTNIYINELKTKIEEHNPQLSVYSQKLIRLSDEIIDPHEIKNGDVFAIFVHDFIQISFFHEVLGTIKFENTNHVYAADYCDIYTIYINNKHCMDFLYNVTKEIYAHSRTCILEQSIHDMDDFGYIITDNTLWYPSLLECIESQPNQFPKADNIKNELETRFKMYPVMNELLDYVELIEKN